MGRYTNLASFDRPILVRDFSVKWKAHGFETVEQLHPFSKIPGYATPSLRLRDQWRIQGRGGRGDQKKSTVRKVEAGIV